MVDVAPPDKTHPNGAKGCPFCHRFMLADRFGETEHFMTCDQCGVCGPTRPTEQQAVADWNKLAEQQAATHPAPAWRGWWRSGPFERNRHGLTERSRQRLRDAAELEAALAQAPAGVTVTAEQAMRLLCKAIGVHPTTGEEGPGIVAFFATEEECEAAIKAWTDAANLIGPSDA